ncbi:hypothetical protein BSZ35_18940 [Salinibacter sp. 10B]|uniref:ParA family protein n=1 Tax=Salinibacter sp. 10B TaxID=1923971 RepID=UPI000D2BA57A|nr:ParA family protein [Salinibacter sp. 10B]PQJ26992.1 hypothetical protein BSZ35_18940 [Salinibacter sp. 10B]
MGAASGRSALDQPARKGPIVASTINFKGGVGKTTSCINLAAAAYEQGLSILILDLDPQGSASEFAALDREYEGPTLYDWFTTGASLREVAVEIREGEEYSHVGSPLGDAPPGSIFLCPADERLTKIQNLLYSENNRSYLNDALRRESSGGNMSAEGGTNSFLSRFDFVFLDVPPSVSALSDNVVLASDLVLLVLSCQFMSLNGLRRFTDMLRRAHRSGADPEWYILPTFYRPTEIESSLVWSRVSEVAGIYPEGRLLSPIGRFAAFGQAFQTGKSIFEFDSAHQGAVQFSAAFAEIQEAARRVAARREGTFRQKRTLSLGNSLSDGAGTTPLLADRGRAVSPSSKE